MAIQNIPFADQVRLPAVFIRQDGSRIVVETKSQIYRVPIGTAYENAEIPGAFTTYKEVVLNGDGPRSY